MKDTDGDDQLDSVEQLRALDGRGEHGPHAVVLTEDGEGLYIVCGNNTQLTEIDESRVPEIWDEDLLLPRVYGRGFMKGTPAKGGYICRTDPDGKEWELICVGFRNQYDAALNLRGDLFTYDADMEWDVNTPWYRPTRVCQAISGAEFGWRNGGGKWPAYYQDSLPPVVNIGPGSPTGVAFGYGAKFPAKYQKAFYVSDWSYGKLYAVHLEESGASYNATFEEFITGTPLPLTDLVINPTDGAMYFAIGGRKVQSGLYRVTYNGDEPTKPISTDVKPNELHQLREKLEALHVGDHPNAVEIAWPYLNHEDRYIRVAARTAIEHRPVEEWKEKALTASDPWTSINSLHALARKQVRTDKGEGEGIDRAIPNWDEAPAEPEEGCELHSILNALNQLEWNSLSSPKKLTALRAYTVALCRYGAPSQSMRETLIARFDGNFPTRSRALNLELAQFLVYLQAPSAAEKIVPMLTAAPTQEEQIDLAKTLRLLNVGWTPELRAEYFRWFNRAVAYRGGASFSKFVEYIKNAALSSLNDEELAQIQPILDARPVADANPYAGEPREFVKKWSKEEVLAAMDGNMSSRDFQNGRSMFGAAKCFACHRFDNEGGALGPDLTSLAGRFSPRDILESILEPDKQISDQYEATQFVTIDGKVIVGRIVNLGGNGYRVNTDMMNPNVMVNIKVDDIEQMLPSKVSMMPKGLLDTLSEDEVLDLMAYLLSRGNENHPMFQE